MDDLYGGTIGQFRHFAGPKSNISFTFMNLDDLDKVETACNSRTRMIWLETPSNPLIKTSDIRKIIIIRILRVNKISEMY